MKHFPENVRPWYRLHATTWLAVVIVAAAMIGAQIPDHSGLLAGTMRLTVMHFTHGWPARCLDRTEWFDNWPVIAGRRAPVVLEVRWNWDLLGLAINAVVIVMLLAATVVVCERWRRKPLARWQLSLRFLFGLTALTAMGLGVWQNQHSISHWLTGAVNREISVFPVTDLFDHWPPISPWYFAIPIGSAMCCVTVVVQQLLPRLVRRYYRRFAGRQPQRHNGTTTSAPRR